MSTPGRRSGRRSIFMTMLERRYRPPGAILSRSERREVCVRGDRDALRRLVEERGPLDGEQDVRFGLELPGPALSGEVAAQLRDEGYRVEVERNEGRALVVATARLVLDEPALRVHTERFCELADRYAARYRGWALGEA